MRYNIKALKNDGRILSFAYVPTQIWDTVIWLEKYWSRFEWLYTNVRLYEDLLPVTNKDE